MNVRYSGQFFEEMEMQMFPFDCQDLQVNVAVLCRNGGNLPVNLTIAPNLIAQVLPDGFQLKHLWQLMTESDFTPMRQPTRRRTAITPMGADSNAQLPVADEDVGVLVVDTSTFGKGTRTFPALKIRAVVARRPLYYVINLMVPMAAFCLLSTSQWAFPRDDAASRNNIGINCVLAWVGYKFVSSTLTPPLAYLTLLDKQSIFCGLIILFCCVAGTVMSAPEEGDKRADACDRYIFYAALAFILIGHLYLAHVVRVSCRKELLQHHWI